MEKKKPIELTNDKKIIEIFQIHDNKVKTDNSFEKNLSPKSETEKITKPSADNKKEKSSNSSIVKIVEELIDNSPDKDLKKESEQKIPTIPTDNKQDNPTKSMDDKQENSIKSMDDKQENSIKSMDDKQENSIKSMDDKQENPIKSMDDKQENPIKSMDDIQEIEPFKAIPVKMTTESTQDLNNLQDLTTGTIDCLLTKSTKIGKGATSVVYKVKNIITNKGYLCLKILNDLVI